MYNRKKLTVTVPKAFFPPAQVVISDSMVNESIFPPLLQETVQTLKTGWGCKQTGKDSSDAPWNIMLFFKIFHLKKRKKKTFCFYHTHLSLSWQLLQQSYRVIPPHSSTNRLSSCKLSHEQASRDQTWDAAARMTDWKADFYADA